MKQILTVDGKTDVLKVNTNVLVGFKALYENNSSMNISSSLSLHGLHNMCISLHV